MHNYKLWLVFNKFTLALMLSFMVFTVSAVVNTNKTRIIFNDKDKEQVIRLSNDGSTPMIIQVWTDEGDMQSQPDTTITPIVALPPIFKMMSQEQKVLRLILSSRDNLDKDKESIFWLNIYQIPPSNAVNKENDRQIILPLRLRLKTFVRPIGVGIPTTNDYQKLTFSKNGNQELIINNPTAWFISLAVTLSDGSMINNLMVSPKSTLSVPTEVTLQTGQSIIYSVINDHGNRIELQSQIQ